MKSRFTNTNYQQQLLDKLSRLLEAGRHTSLNVEIDKKRFIGARMSNVSLSESVISFQYNGEGYTLNLSDLKKVRRLRSRKYLLYFEAQKTMGTKVEKAESKKSEEKTEKKTTKKKTSKKTKTEE